MHISTSGLGQDRAQERLKSKDFWGPWAGYSPEILHENNKYGNSFAVGQGPSLSFLQVMKGANDGQVLVRRSTTK